MSVRKEKGHNTAENSSKKVVIEVTLCWVDMGCVSTCIQLIGGNEKTTVESLERSHTLIHSKLVFPMYNDMNLLLKC